MPPKLPMRSARLPSLSVRNSAVMQPSRFAAPVARAASSGAATPTSLKMVAVKKTSELAPDRAWKADRPMPVSTRRRYFGFRRMSTRVVDPAVALDSASAHARASLSASMCETPRVWRSVRAAAAIRPRLASHCAVSGVVPSEDIASELAARPAASMKIGLHQNISRLPSAMACAPLCAADLMSVPADSAETWPMTKAARDVTASRARIEGGASSPTYSGTSIDASPEPSPVIRRPAANTPTSVAVPQRAAPEAQINSDRRRAPERPRASAAVPAHTAPQRPPKSFMVTTNSGNVFAHSPKVFPMHESGMLMHAPK
mmetsp:Transcript_3800/g.15358  ORF Transcript_3800/g.15358 Transcript_3800/m.15358 type:complete len:316 (-) Transcript_3800:87-1034(-)